MPFSFVDLSDGRYTHSGPPETCPICGFSIYPEEINAIVLSGPRNEPEEKSLEIVYRCIRSDCGRFFVARYRKFFERRQISPNQVEEIRKFILFDCLPKNSIKEIFPKEIADLSPLFPDIYSQALDAEALGLHHIAGMGFRKAFEFLIKDYCISNNPSDTGVIRAMFLGKCINQYIAGAAIKDCANRAVWLGNDETHYERRWSGKDIDDLKVLIRLSVNWIHNEILTAHYLTTMPAP